MPDQLDADLELSISGALQAVSELGSTIETTLAAAAASFEEEFARITGSIPPITVEADQGSLEAVTSGIDSAVTAVDGTVPVEANIDAAVDQLSLFESDVAAVDATVEVDADTSSAQESLDELSSSTDKASKSTSSFGESAGLAAGAAALARGEVGGLTEGASALAGTSTVALGAVGALGASVGFLFEQGVEATSALQRFKTIVGESSEAVLHFQVGDLNADLDKLAIRLGTDDEALRNTSATLFQFAINSGSSRERAVEFTNQIDALAARAVALNPALGSVADVADSMSARLARGGRFAASFGVSLTAAEIETRALANTNKASAGDLTLFEKSAAAADIAVEKYGGTLNETVAKGAKNATIEQRSLEQQLHNVFEEAGKPLVAPVLQLFEDSQPAVKAIGESLSEIAIAALPAVRGGLEALVPLLQLAALGIQTITELTDNFGVSATVTGAALGFLVGGEVGAFVGAIAGLASDLGLFGHAEESVAQSTSKLAKQIDALAGADALARFDKSVSTHIQHMVDIGVPGLDRLKVTLRDFRLLAEDDIGAAQRVLTGLDPGSTKYAQFEAIINRVSAAQRSATSATKAADDATVLLTGSYDDQIKALEAKNDALLAAYDATFAAYHADERARDAVDTLNSSYDEAVKAGKSVTEATEAQSRALTQAEEDILHAAAAAHQKALKDHESEGAIAANSAAVAAQRSELQKFIDQLAPDSPLRIFLQQYIDKLNDPAVNSTHTATLTIRKDQALIAIEDVSRALRGIGVSVPEIDYSVAAEGMIVEPRAGGTLVKVGEAGAREIITPTDDDSRALALLRAGGLGHLLGATSAYPVPIGGAPAPASMSFEVQINVTGVDAEHAREAGREAAAGFEEGLARRGITLAARSGGG